MKLPRRTFLHLTAGVAAVPALPRAAFALDYPTRPVRLIVGFPPGGVTDITARLIGPWLSERLGKPFVIENRPGASSMIATELVAKAKPDGYTLLTIADVNAWNMTIYHNVNFKFTRDIAPVASICRDSFVMVVNPSLPAKTGAEFIAYAKANPGKVNMATSGSGSGSDLYGQLFKVKAGVDLVTVHYRGVGPALPDLMAGRVEVIFLPVATANGYIKAGTLRALGVTASRRMALLPDVPAIGEFVPGYEGDGWVGIGAPANTPSEIIAIINTQVNAALGDAAFKARLVNLGGETFASSPAEFGKFTADYAEKWSNVIRAAGIKPE
ncbi:MAG: tripartite tricarboxylate transporter substrate binding protein [Xanthobacteraceae bacterium]